MKALEQQRGFMDLVHGIRDYQAQRFSQAQVNWQSWAGQNDDILGHFARSLIANIDPDGRSAANLYAPELAGDSRQIDLFREIARLPHIHFPRQVTSELHELYRRPGSTHLELGIGSGEHVEQLVRASEGGITKVIGVDLDPISVETSGQRLARLGVSYVGIVEPFDQLNWSQLALLAGESSSVSAAFALHHLSLRAKQEVLEGVRSLAPRLVTLIEPSSAHWSADLLTRFVHAYSHFQMVGEVIGELDASTEMRRGLLQFFGREIRDIMRDSADRFERHEQWTFWYGELLRCGMTPIELTAFISKSDTGQVQFEESAPGAATISKKSVPLVTVFSFECRAKREASEVYA